MTPLVIKPGQNFEELNPKLCKIAILNQVILEGFDEIACEKEIWNKNFKKTGNEFLKLIEGLQEKIYNQHYENNQNTFIYSEECTNRTLDLMLKGTLEDYIDVMGFLEVKRANKAWFKDFLMHYTSVINNVDNKKTIELKVSEIVYKICHLFDVTFDEVKSDSKQKNISKARKLIAYFLHSKLKWTNEHIGEVLNRNHTTIYVMIKNVIDETDDLAIYKKCLEKVI